MPPSVKQCPHCLKKWLWSTYELIRHVEQCPKKTSITVHTSRYTPNNLTKLHTSNKTITLNDINTFNDFNNSNNKKK